MNARGIRASSDVSNYRKFEKPIKIHTYIYYFTCETIRRNCPSVGWVQEKRFQVDVSIKRLHVNHMNIKDCIIFSESKHTSEHKSNTLRTGSSSHSELTSTVYDQQKILVLTNRNNIVSHKTWYDLRDIINWRWRDLHSQSSKFFKTYTLTSDDSLVKYFSPIIRSQVNNQVSDTKAIIETHVPERR